MDFEKTPNFPKKEPEKEKPEKSFEEIRRENIEKIFKGRPEEWRKNVERLKKQRTEFVEEKIKEHEKNKDSEKEKSCIHCGSNEHRSYNCPKLKDPDYLKEFMEKLKKKYH